MDKVCIIPLPFQQLSVVLDQEYRIIEQRVAYNKNFGIRRKLSDSEVDYLSDTYKFDFKDKCRKAFDISFRTVAIAFGVRYEYFPC